MAKRLNLQEYQENILSRMKALEQGGEVVTTSRLGVQVGDDAWLISLGDVGEVLPVPEIHPVPLTRPWFMGMSSVRGNLYAVSDLSAFLGGRAVRLGTDSRLLLAGSRFGINSAFAIDRLHGLRNISGMTATKVPRNAPAWQIGAYKDENGRVWNELDVSTLLNSTGFMQVAI